MKNDDAQTGHLFSRREAMVLLGAGGVGVMTTPLACAEGPRPSCVVRPQQIEGPYFVEGRLNRSDIRPDAGTGAIPAGVPLTLTMAVSALRDGRCDPLPGAQVDLWQCDARGVYSGVHDPGFSTVGQSFLRGHQLTGQDGQARFMTIYPGWYPGRTVHLHFKIRTEPAARRGYEFTSQLYFADELTDRIHAQPPYAWRPSRRTRNRQDGVFRRGGDQLVLQASESGEGVAASFSIALRA